MRYGAIIAIAGFCGLGASAHAEPLPPPAAAAPAPIAGSMPAADLAFYRANEAYRLGRYDEAAVGYRAILDGGLESAAVYYNLGNAWLKSGHEGEAIWAYLKAAALAPRDPDLRTNLRFASSLVPEAQSASVRPPRLARWITGEGRFTTRELAVAWLGLCWWLVLARVAAVWWAGARPAARVAAWLAGIAVLAMSVVLAAQLCWVDAVPKAVTIVPNAVVKFAPQDTGTDHFTLPEGAVVRVVQQQPGWAQIQRSDGRAGWVRAEAVKPL